MFFDTTQELSEDECAHLLTTSHVGRLSLTINALPVVIPVNYQYLGGSIILSLGEGAAQRAISDGNIVGLGVDNAHLDEPMWAVLVIGRAKEITDETERAQYRRLGLTAQTDSTAGTSRYMQLAPDLVSGDRANCVVAG